MAGASVSGVRFSKALQTCAQLSEIESPARIMEEVVAISGTLGLGRMSIIDSIGIDRPIMDLEGRRLIEGVFGWPRKLTEWWYAKPRNHGYIDAQRCLVERAPFASALFNPAYVCKGDDGALLARLQEMDFNNAIIVPVHLPNARASMVSWSTPGADLSQVRRHQLVLQVLAHACIDAVERLRVGTKAEKNAGISARQAECIGWAAAGKTAKETARIMNLSPYTVEDHLKSAATRLNVQGKAQLIATALKAGFI